MTTSVFRAAIHPTDQTVDPGYLALFWIMAVVITAIPFMCIFTMVAMFLDPEHRFLVQDLGIGVGSVCTGFGVAVGAVGAFRMGDKDRPGTSSTTTTTTKVAAIREPAPPPPQEEERGTPENPLHVALEEPVEVKGATR
jgi:hypothetical protein